MSIAVREIVKIRSARGAGVWVNSLLLILAVCPKVAAWNGEDWGSWSRGDIVARANEMIDSTWRPRNTINNFGYESTYHTFDEGTDYTGEAYSQGGSQENWSEFKNLVDNTGGGTTSYGNDCSGFASICWKLGARYTTSSFETDATQADGYVDSLGDTGTCESAGLMQGDACNDSGNHIILFNRSLGDGRMESMEQTPWTACRRTWYWSSLGSYRPIRRRDLADASPAPSAPDPSIQWLDQGVNSGDNQKVRVSCGKPDRANELYYEMEGAGTNNYGWTGDTEYIDSDIHDSQTVSVRCKARGGGGESDWSGWKSVTIGDRTAPPVLSPSIVWLDQGLNSGDEQKVKVTCGMPTGATYLYYDMSGAGCNDYGWTTATSYTDTSVYDSQTVSVRCMAKDASGNYSAYSGWVSVVVKDRTPPNDPSPGTPVWEDQGLNTRDTQKVVSTIPLPAPDAVQVWHELMTGGGTVLQDSGWTATTAWTFSNVGDEQWVKVNGKARDTEGNYTGWVTSAQTWVKDRTPPGAPTITHNWPTPLTQGEGEESINPYYLTGTKTEDTATIWLNGGRAEATFPSGMAWRAPFVIHDKGNGISAVAKDLEGNYSEEEVEDEIVVDIGEWYVDVNIGDREDGFPLDGFTVETAYRKIEDANGWADGGDEVHVAEGVYKEQVRVAAGTVLRGAGRETSVIEGPGNGDAVVGGEGAELEGFTIKGSGHVSGDYGVDWGGASSFTVKGCTVTGNLDGVGVIGCAGAVLRNSIISGNMRDGVVLKGTDAAVENNTVDGNGRAGIFCEGAEESVVRNNIVTRNYTGIEVYRGGVRLSYNDVWGNHGAEYKNCAAGPGDISAEPGFKGD